MAKSVVTLRVDCLNVHYGQSHVLRDVSMHAESGKVTALLGRNGAGKSTCMHALMGLLKTTSGSVSLNNVELASKPPVQICRAGIALVPQGRRIFRSLTVQENLVVASSARDGASRWTVDAVQALFPRLHERRRSMAGTLSGGEQQMLAIGRALMTNPDLLLLDEPSEGLAPQIVNEVSACIHKLRAEGMAIVLVEQNLHLAQRLADRVVIMSTGEIVFDGSVDSFADDKQAVEAHLGVQHDAVGCA